ncbi:hypothetical protein ACA910_010729 [Epithemia clementina (nom. ined.)]
MISAIDWVPAGVANPAPKRYELSAKEREMIEAMEKEEAEKTTTSSTVGEEKSKPKKDTQRKRGRMKVELASNDEKTNELPADLRMDEYSSDEDDGNALGKLLVGRSQSVSNEIASQYESSSDAEDKDEEQATQTKESPRLGLAKSDDEDDDDDDDDDDDLEDAPDMREYMPIDVDGLDSMGLYNIGLGSGADMEEMDFDDDGSDAEDVKLTKDDAIILVAKTEDDFSSLEVHVYDQKKGSLYVHHDIPLPSFPLCLAHGQVSSDGEPGNFCAVGTFDTGIEIWNLDVLNALEPTCMLGGEVTTTTDKISKRGKARNAPSLRPGSHTEAVMALSWNSIHKQVIASGSADMTVKLWDVTQAGGETAVKCNAATFDHHRGKVQSVVWHPNEGTLLATGSYDKTVALLDARSQGQNIKSVKTPSDCEVVAWDPFHPEHLTVAVEDGTIFCWDVRKFETSSPLWTVVANEYGGVTDLSFSPHVPGFFATSSIDKTVTLWDLGSEGNSPPRSCGSKDMCAGKLYSVKFYGSSPALLACGGSGNSLSIWDMQEEDVFRQNFAKRMGVGQEESRAESSSPPNQEDLAAMTAERPSTQRNDSAQRTEAKKFNTKKGKKKARKRRG